MPKCDLAVLVKEAAKLADPGTLSLNCLFNGCWTACARDGVGNWPEYTRTTPYLAVAALVKALSAGR